MNQDIRISSRRSNKNRKKIISAVLIGILAFNSFFIITFTYMDTTVAGPYRVPGEWTLILVDDFNGNSINTSTWSYGYPPYGFNCLGQCHNHQGWMVPENVIVNDGLLRIKGENFTHPDAIQWELDNGPHYWGDTYLPLNYTTGAITSHSKFNFTYGYIEAKQRMPEGPTGFWPAFWTIQSSGEPGSYGEIDILEWLSGETSTYHVALHTAGPGEPLTSKGGTYMARASLTAEFHVYGVEWYPDRISFFFDNKEVYRNTNVDEIEHLGSQHLRINMAVGGWARAPDENTIWPAFYETDWIRVWQYKDYIT